MSTPGTNPTGGPGVTPAPEGTVDETDTEEVRARRAMEAERVRNRLRFRDNGIPQVNRDAAESVADVPAPADTQASLDEAQRRAAVDGSPRGRRRPLGGSGLLPDGAGEPTSVDPVVPGGPRPIPKVDQAGLETESGTDVESDQPADETPEQRRERIRKEPMRMADAVFKQVDPDDTPPVVVGDPPDPADTQAVMDETRRRGKAAGQGRKKAIKDALRDPKMRGASPEDRAERVMDIQDQYSQLMVLNCVKPLTQNVGPRELVESATAMAVLWALSPRVQDLVSGYQGQIKEAMRALRKDEKEQNSKSKLGASTEEMNKAQADAKRKDQILVKNTETTLAGGHAVFGLEDAAQTLIAMDEALYENVRDGSDYVEAQQAHNETVDLLMGTWQKQGLSPTEIKTEMWRSLGESAAQDPGVAARYWHTFRGDLRPTARNAAGGWDGKWAMLNGKKLDPATSSLFVVRMPLNPDQHLIQMASLVESDLTLAAAKGPEALKETLIGHRMAWELRDEHVTGTKPGTISSKTVHAGEALAAVGRAQSGILSMADDGIHPDLRQAVATGAVTRAYEKFAADNPEVMAKFTKAFPEGVTQDDLDTFRIRAERVSTRLELAPILDSEKIDNPALTAWEEAKRSAGMGLPAPVAEYSRLPAEPDQVPEQLEAITDHEQGSQPESSTLRPEPHPDHRPSRAAVVAQREKERAPEPQASGPVTVPKAEPVRAKDPGGKAGDSGPAGPVIPKQAGPFLGSAQPVSASTTGNSDRGGNTGFGHEQLVWAPAGPDGKPQPGLGRSREQASQLAPTPTQAVTKDADPTTAEREKPGESSSRNRLNRNHRHAENQRRQDSWDGPEM